jgi:hypothetical protein
MGKRELIIAAAFIVVAALAYQLTAPAAKPGERRFSLGQVFSNIRSEIRANSASTTVTKTGVVALNPGVTEVRLTTSRSTPMTVIGEKRDDVGYEAVVESTGPDEATARQYAERTAVTSDDIGAAQKIDVVFTREGQQSARVTMRVPARLLVRMEGSGHVVVSDVRALDLRNVTGDVTITNILEKLSGSHRSGELNVTKAGAVDLMLSSSRARLTDIEGAITLNGRNGDCVIAKSRGTVEATMANAEFTVTDHAGPIHVSGELGTLRVVSPAKDLAVDVRRMTVEITLGLAIPATILTSGEALKLTLAGPPAISIDALATDGAIRVTDLALEAVKDERGSRLNAAVGAGGPRVVLRNTGADIVISLRK